MSPEASLRAWMPAIHAGMTVISILFFVTERKIMARVVELAVVSALFNIPVDRGEGAGEH